MEKSNKYILHVDGDSFFASCEVAVNPKLRGKPVVTGQERGIASAMTYEAKALGITRGMPIFQIKKMHPEVIVVSSDYDLYSLFSRRMINIVRRFTDQVDEYSIDECFADLTWIIEKNKRDTLMIGKKLKYQLQTELGMTFSLGIAPTKVLAKVASKTNKPNGFTIITHQNTRDFLKDIPIQKVWGIGRQTSALLYSKNIKNSLDFVDLSFDYVRSLVSKPYQEIYKELKGTYSSLSIFDTQDSESDSSKSISRTRTFYPPSSDLAVLYSELSQNVEEACLALRREGLVSGDFSFFLKDNDFRYYRTDMSLNPRSSSPEDVLEIIKTNLFKICKKGMVYRASGVTMMNLKGREVYTYDLFDSNPLNNKRSELYNTIDNLQKRKGKYSIFLGSSIKALSNTRRKENRRSSFINNLPFPYLGEVN